MGKSGIVNAWSAGFLFQLLASTAAAQVDRAVAVPQSQAVSLQQTLEEIRAELAEQRRLIAEQSDRIEAQNRLINLLRQRLDEGIASSQGDRVNEVRGEAAAANQTSESPAEAQAAKRLPELPEKIVTAGDFPGSFRIPGTTAGLKIGGQLRSTLVHTLGPLGTDDRFIASSIPVAVERAGQDARTTYTAAPTQINFDVRSQVPFGVLRAFVEGDFAGSGNTMRLRHSFVHLKGWIFGQTWSTFSDPEVEPIDLDFEGENALSSFRQAQVRYARQIRAPLEFALAVENPAPDITGAEGVNLTPDVVARLRWEPPDGGRGLVARRTHLQAAVLIRTLRGELADQSEVTTSGFGATLSGVLIPRWNSADRIKFATYAGSGIGRYITDLGTAGGQDAVYDAATNSLRALPVSSAYVAYERQWQPAFASSLAYGVVTVHNLDVQQESALHRTQRATANIAWTPLARTDFLLEFLAGERVNKDGQRGVSTQIQAGWKVRF